MKQSTILILIGVVVIGLAVWFITQKDTAVPTPIDSIANPADEDEQIDTDYVGLTEAEAEVLASRNDVLFRVVERDGEMLPTTRDYRPGRINAVVESEVVTSYTVEGMENETGMQNGAHDEIIGKTEVEAEAYAVANNVSFRIGARDGEPLGVTMDYRPGRITAEIENGVVTGYTVE